MNTSDRVILQVPMSRTLKERAEIVALDQGFSSLQEIVRVILNRFTAKELQVTITNAEPIKLSAAAKKRYQNMREDFRQKRNVYLAENADDLIRQLNS